MSHQLQPPGDVAGPRGGRRWRPGIVWPLAGAVVAAVFVGLFTVLAGGPVRIDADRQARLYEWRRVDQTPLAELTPVMEFWAQRGGVTMVPDVTVLAQAVDEPMKSKVHADLARYVAAAQGYGLEVEALAGDPDLVGNHKAVTTINDSLAQFNERYPTQRIDYLVWDVEPWQDTDWQPQAYLDFVEFAVDGAPAAVVPGFAVPVWFIGADAAAVTWGGETASTGQHIARAVTARPGAFIAVMDYFDTQSAAAAGFEPWLALGVPVRSVFEIGESEPGTTMLGWTWPEQGAFLNSVSQDWVQDEHYQGVDVDSALFLPGLPGGLVPASP